MRLFGLLLALLLAVALPAAAAEPALTKPDVAERAIAMSVHLAPEAVGEEPAAGVRSLSALVPKGARTEIDYAFFLDLARSTTVGDKFEPVARRIQDAQFAAGRRLAPGERRRVIGRMFAELMGRELAEDRAGRNVAYYVEAVPPDQLTAAEREAWARHGSHRAADFGLSDDRPY